MPAPGSDTKAATSGPSVGSLLQALAKERSKGLVLDLRTGAIVQKSTPAKPRAAAEEDSTPPPKVSANNAGSPPARVVSWGTPPGSDAIGSGGNKLAPKADDVSDSSQSPSSAEEDEEDNDISEEPPRSSIPRSESPSSQSLEPEAHFEPPVDQEQRDAAETQASPPKKRPQPRVTLVPSKAILQAGGASNALDSRSNVKDRRKRHDSEGTGEVRLTSRKDLERATGRQPQRGTQSPARWRPSHPGGRGDSDEEAEAEDSDDSSAFEDAPLVRARGTEDDPLAEFHRDRPPVDSEELGIPSGPSLVARDMQKAEDRENVKAKKKRAKDQSLATSKENSAEEARLTAESTDVLPKEAKKRLREEKVRDRAAAAAAAAATSSAETRHEDTAVASADAAAPGAQDVTADAGQREHKKKKKKRRKHSAVNEDEVTPQLVEQQVETPAAPEGQHKEKKSKKSKRKHEKEAAPISHEVAASGDADKRVASTASAACDNFWGPPSAYAPPPASAAAAAAGTQPLASTSQALSPFDVKAGAPVAGQGEVSVAQPDQARISHKKRKRRRHKSRSSGSSSSSSGSGSGGRSRRRRRSRSRGGRRRRRKHSKSGVRPPDALAFWPPPPGAGFTPQPWGWPPAYGWPPSAPPQQSGSAWSQTGPAGVQATAPPENAAPTGAVAANTAVSPAMAAGSAPATGMAVASTAPGSVVGTGAPSAGAVAATAAPTIAVATTVEATASASALHQPLLQQEAVPEQQLTPSIEVSELDPARKSETEKIASPEEQVLSLILQAEARAAKDLQKISGQARGDDEAPVTESDAQMFEHAAEHLASDPYGGAQEDPYAVVEDDPYGGAAEDPYCAGGDISEAPLPDALMPESGVVVDNPDITDPLVLKWQGPAKALWMTPPFLELDPELARPTPPNKQRARRKRRKIGPKQRAAWEAANPREPVAADLGTEVAAEHAEVLQMPLWSRISEWSTLIPLELDESLRRLPTKVKSAEYGRRMALRSEQRAAPPEMDVEIPSNPADPPEFDNVLRKESFLLSIGNNPRQGVPMVAWYSPPRLALPQDAVRDPAAYTGTERARRVAARQGNFNLGGAPVMQFLNQPPASQVMPSSAPPTLGPPAPATAVKASAPLPTAVKASSPMPHAGAPTMTGMPVQAVTQALAMQALQAAALPAFPPVPTSDTLTIFGTASKAAPARPTLPNAAGFATPGWTPLLAAPTLAGDPLAGNSVAAMSHPQAEKSYNDKLLAFINKLETTTVPTDVAVREFWGELSVEDRTRFSSKFPQFMHHVTGPRAKSAQQLRAPVRPKQATRALASPPQA